MTDNQTTSKLVVYGLYDPRTGELRYVGKTVHGVRRRLGQHLHDQRRRTHLSAWIAQLVRDGLRPLALILDTCLFPEMLGDLEKKWIALMRKSGARLVNLTDGGDGMSGHVPSATTRAKLAASNRASQICRSHLREIQLARQRPVCDQDGRRYDSLREAAAAVGSDEATIRRALAGSVLVVRRQYGFRAADNDNPPWTTRSEWEAWVAARRASQRRHFAEGARRRMLGKRPSPETVRRRAIARSRPVVDQNGIVYSSVKEAALVIGVGPASVSSMLGGRRPHVKGYVFRFHQEAA